MAEDDFIQEGYEPLNNNESYVESIKFSDDFTTKTTDSFDSKPINEKRDISKSKKVQKEVVRSKPVIERAEEPVKKKAAVPDKKIIKKEPEKQIVKKKPVQTKLKTDEDDEIMISFNFMKKIKAFFNKKNTTNSVIALVAIIAIIAIAALILNIDKIFPNNGTPIAFVNGEVLTSKDIENTLKTVPSIYRGLITDEEILNQTIINKLMLQEAKKSGVIVTDDEVEQIIDKTIAKAQISKNDFKKYLAEQNLTYEDMQMFYRTNLMIEKFLEKTAYVGINITSNQIKGFYKNNSAELVNITFEEVADQIEAYLLQQAKQEAFKAYAAKVMAEADIRILTKGSPIAEATEGNFSSTDVEKYASCATKNGLDKKSVVFIYSDSCPHCQRMKPIVTELEGAGANFKWASVYDSDMKVALSECYKDVLADGVPQFICARDGQTIVGETSQANLGAFAAACNK